MNLKNLLSGYRILEEVDSPYNGKLLVIKDIAWGTYIQTMSSEGNRLTQSGGIMEAVWKSAIPEIKKQNVEDCLILGLGGGSAAKVIRDRWPDVRITGVDIDKTIVELGEKHLDLKTLNVNLVIKDAAEYCKEVFITGKKHYDLILIDLYMGREIPPKFTKEHFLKRVKSLLTQGGVAVFNRLYGPNEIADSREFGEELKKVFGNLEPIYPEANVMFLVYNI